MKEFATKLKELGLKVIKKVETGIGAAKNGVEATILNDNLHRRFNLENPYRFIVCEPDAKPSFIQTLLPVNAKRYVEDDAFVFFGSPTENKYRVNDIITDISDNSRYQITQVEGVLTTVVLNDTEHEVKGTAVKCKVL
ncbi:MAG: hypothetical protein MZU97_16500 [Bacillus subtilis]|nr:hypothetical protein [Bacillus subtilis]